MRVAVLGGGRSSEHEVSLASAEAVREGLRAGGHEPLEVLVERDGAWRHEGRVLPLTPAEGLLGADVVFPVLHGPFGEDGTVQGLLECLDVPYVGAGVLSSAVCMDKLVFKQLMGEVGLPQVAHAGILEAEWNTDRDAVLQRLETLGLPVFVKPARLGSSVGIARAASKPELAAAVEQALGHDPRVIVEAMADGLEVECSVMGHGDPQASEPGEIVLTGASPGGWYDYDAKYTPGGMELEVPARISPAARLEVQRIAVKAFAESGCSGLARVDFFVAGERVILNELNTMPGFTETSVFGTLWEASGVPYADLLERLLGFALERHRAERAHRF